MVLHPWSIFIPFYSFLHLFLFNFPFQFFYFLKGFSIKNMVFYLFIERDYIIRKPGKIQAVVN